MKEMSPEDKLRIEKEAEGISRLRVWPEHVRVTFKTGYINGATSEHERMAELLKEERNKAIDEVGNLFFALLPVGEVQAWDFVKASKSFLKELESLKSQ